MTLDKFPSNQLASNFQVLPLWNDASNAFGAVDQYLVIPQADIQKLKKMQTYPDGWTPDQKMQWLGGDYRGRIYMHDRNVNWDTSESLRWGTLVLGGNLVEIDKIEIKNVHLPALPMGEKESVEMGRLVCFTPDDWNTDHWSNPAKIHRAYCAYRPDDIKGDSPKGVVFTPLWSPKHWKYVGPNKPQPTSFWIPMRWLIKEY